MTGGTIVVTNAAKAEWSTKLLAMDKDKMVCLYSLCLPCCAMATARTEYDESNFIFNLLTLNPSMGRSIIRAGYGIEGNTVEDIVLPLFCQPCVVAQMLEEVRKRGAIPGATGGQQDWKKGLFQIDVKACLFAWCFTPCALAESRKRFDDSNYLLNCLCSSAALNRSIIRQGYGLKGDCLTDLLFGLCLPMCTVSQALQETEARGRVNNSKPAAGQMQ
jgi:Cys-rich protein (TIGR01571 family)